MGSIFLQQLTTASWDCSNDEWNCSMAWAVSNFYEPRGVGIASQAVGGKRALNVQHC